MTEIILIIVAAVVGLAAGYIVRKQVGESKIKSAEEEAARIMEEATRNTDAIRKEAILEAKDEAYKIRNEAEQEVKERRAELQRSEKRLIQKEESMNRKYEALEQKESIDPAAVHSSQRMPLPQSRFGSSGEYDSPLKLLNRPNPPQRGSHPGC